MSDLLPVPPPLGWRDRLAALIPWRPLRPRHVVGAVVVGLASLGVAVVGVVWVLRTPPPTEALIPQVTAPATASPPPTDTGGSSLFVQAAGAVVAPGVYRVPADARVIDVIDAAGGLAGGADPDRLALAAKVSDGERVYVPTIGEPMPSSPSGAGGATNDDGPVDLNTADEQQLDALPGVGPATASAIVAYRESHGPFRSVDQLLEVRGIGPAKLDQLVDLVTV